MSTWDGVILRVHYIILKKTYMIHYVLLHVQNVLQQSDCTSYLGSYEIAAFYERTRSFKQLKSCLNLIATVFCCSQIRWIALRVYKLRIGFSVPSII